MCSNRANNRTRHLSYYVTQVNGRNVDRRRIADPFRRAAGMPRMLRPADQPLGYVANEAQIQQDNAAGDELLIKDAIFAMNRDGVFDTIAHFVGDGIVNDRPEPTNFVDEKFDLTDDEDTGAPVADRVAIYATIPAFNPTATHKELAAREAERNRDAIKADREARRAHRHQIKKLRSNKSAKQDDQNMVNVLKLERDNAEGLAAAHALLLTNVPKKVFNFKGFKSYCSWYGHNPLAHELVKQKCYDNSTFVTVIDLRDDKERSPNGETIRRGAIYEDGQVKACATKVSVEIFTEVFGNVERSIKELERITRFCPSLRSLDIEILGSNDLHLAEQILESVKHNRYMWAANLFHLSVTYKASRYDEDDE